MLTHITTKIKLNFVDMKKLLFFLFFFWWLLNFACSVASVMSDSLQPHGLYTSRLLNPWIFPARTLEYAAMASSRGSSQTRDRTLMSCIFYITDGSFTAEPPRELGYLILENHKYPDINVFIIIYRIYVFRGNQESTCASEEDKSSKPRCQPWAEI